MSRWSGGFAVAFVVILLGLSIYLITSSAINQYNFPTWPGNVLSIISCFTVCSDRCTQHVTVDISWQVEKHFYQQHNVFETWEDTNRDFCNRLRIGKDVLNVMTLRETPQIILALVPAGQNYYAEGLYTGILILALLTITFVCVTICVCSEKRKPTLLY